MGLTSALSYYLSSRAGNICYWLFAMITTNPLNNKIMLVVLDLSAPRCIKCGVQFCNCPEGFLSIKEMHPDDDFCFADERAEQSFITFMDFMEAMGFTSDDWFAETYFWDNEYDPNDFHVERRLKEELLRDEYYAELQEAHNETIYSLKYSFN